MAVQGGYRACSRIGIESSASPFLKITFETASHFLTVHACCPVFATRASLAASAAHAVFCSRPCFRGPCTRNMVLLLNIAQLTADDTELLVAAVCSHRTGHALVTCLMHWIETSDTWRL